MSRRSLGVGVLALLVVCALILVSLSGMFSPDHGKARTAANEGWIEGHVTNGTGPIANAYVLYLLSTSGGAPLGSTRTNATGYYNLSVLGGVAYTVAAFDGGYYTSGGGAAPPVGGTATLDLVMNSIYPLAADVTLTGYVLDGSHNPVSGGNIAGIVFDPSTGGNGFPMYGNVTTANATTGLYTVNVIPGSAGGGVAALDVPVYGFQLNTTSAPFVSGNTYWINITLSAPVSTDDAVVSGWVTEEGTGTPLVNAVVTVQTQNPFNGQTGYSNLTLTDSSGYYSMNVTNGSGRLWFQKLGYSMYLDDNFQIAAGQHILANATLLPANATIRGNVTDKKTGLPLADAQVYEMDSQGHFAEFTTNSTGQYVLDAFASSSVWVAAGHNGYGTNSTMMTILPGEHLWLDFALPPYDAWITGTVRDLLSNAPIPNATVELHAQFYDSGAETDGSGHYNVSLISGNYSVSAHAFNFSSFYDSVAVQPGGNTYDIALMPMNPAATTRLYGWVNDSISGEGLSNAQVKIALAPPYQSNMISNNTNSTGYYEMWVVPALLEYVATNDSHVHAQGFINATGQAEVRLDILLEPDPWGPNTTYTQSPRYNISWTNPSTIGISVVEKDPAQFALAQFMHVNSSAGWSDYAVVQMLYDSFDPFWQGQPTLPFAKVGDSYTISVHWEGLASGGWLSNGTLQMYFGSYQMNQGPVTYQGVRGMYSNSTIGPGQKGTAWFDNSTGDFAFFSFDNGTMAPALQGDPTARFSPLVSLLRVNDVTNQSKWFNDYAEGVWSLAGLKFTFDPVLPSGRYITEFSCQDFGNRGSGNGTFITVDNDPPVANAGPDQATNAGQLVVFDGTGSTDNVGIANYTWVVDNGGTPVMLWGPNPSFAFLSEGVYNVTLTVKDGAGHTSTDKMVVTVSAAIPEFPSLLVPISGMLALVAVFGIRRRGRAR